MYPFTLDSDTYLINEDLILDFKGGNLVVGAVRNELTLLHALIIAAFEHAPVISAAGYGTIMDTMFYSNRVTLSDSYPTLQKLSPVEYAANTAQHFGNESVLFCVFDPAAKVPRYNIKNLNWDKIDTLRYVNASRISEIITLF